MIEKNRFSVRCLNSRLIMFELSTHIVKHAWCDVPLCAYRHLYQLSATQTEFRRRTEIRVSESFNEKGS